MRRDRAAIVTRLVLGVLAGLATYLVVGGAYRHGMDLFLTLMLPAPPAPGLPLDRPVKDLEESRVVIVDVSVRGSDDQRIIPRAKLARLLRKLKELDAWVVGLDILFETAGDPEESAELERAIADSGRVVLATQYDPRTFQEIPSRFAGAAAAVGLANMFVDPRDSFIRAVQHYYETETLAKRYSMGIELLRRAVRFPDPAPAPVSIEGDVLRLGDRGDPAAIEIPVDEQGFSLIPFLGPAGSLPILPWEGVLEMDPATLRLTSKIVLVGNTDLDIKDAYLTSFHSASLARISGVEIQAQSVMGTLLGTRYVRESGSSAALLALVAGLVAATVSLLFVPWMALAVDLAAVGALWASCCQIFVTSGTYHDPLTPTVAVAVIFLTSTMLNASRREDASGLTAEERKALAVAGTLMLEGKAAEALAELEKHLPTDGSPLKPRMAGALARAALAAGQSPVARLYLTGFQPATMPVDELMDLANRLEAADQLDLAVTVLEPLQAKDPTLAGGTRRLQALRDKDQLVPREIREKLGPRYSDWAYLGRGGMARVYRARDAELGKDVAIKVPEPEMMVDREGVKRFIREMETLSRLSHPSIVKLFEIGRHEPYFYTMELIFGRSFTQVLDQETKLTPKQALTYLTPIAEALAFCHRQNIVHRDVKPDNIMVEASGRSLLTDFGLAFLTEETRMTRLSIRIGTPMYMSPEQLDGEMPGPPVDIYAFGLILHETVTGEHPFQGQALHLRARKPAPPLPVELDCPGLADIVARCLVTDPDHRIPNGDVLLGELSRLKV